jgi:hypothetical protein
MRNLSLLFVGLLAVVPQQNRPPAATSACTTATSNCTEWGRARHRVRIADGESYF